MGDAIEKASADESGFMLAQRQAKALAASQLVPQAYQGNPANCLIALEVADRIGASPMMVMQNMHLIHGKPSWSSTFLIATVNHSGRWTPLKYRMVGEPDTPGRGCYVVARDRECDEECEGPVVTMGMAKAEGWSTKSGSKWKTMPELMLRYRAAAFWIRLHAPELSMGLHTSDEIADMHGPSVALAELPPALAPGNTADLEASLLGAPAETAEVVENAPTADAIDASTGELTSDEEAAMDRGELPL